MTSSMTGYAGYSKPQSSLGGGGYNDKVPKGYKVSQLQNFTPEQMELFGQGLNNVGPNSYLSRLAGGDQSLFGEVEAPALKQFSQLQGGLASRFSGIGSGSRKSSGFQNQATSASQNFAQQLQANRMGLQRQAQQDLHGMTRDLLNMRPYDRQLYEKPQKQGFDWGGLAGAGIGGVGGFFAGGPMGAITGASLGYGIGSGKGGGGGSFQSSPNWDAQDWAVNNLPGSVI